MLIKAEMGYVEIGDLASAVNDCIPLRRHIQKELATPEAFGSVSGFSVTSRTYTFTENMVKEGMVC